MTPQRSRALGHRVAVVEMPFNLKSRRPPDISNNDMRRQRTVCSRPIKFRAKGYIPHIYLYMYKFIYIKPPAWWVGKKPHNSKHFKCSPRIATRIRWRIISPRPSVTSFLIVYYTPLPPAWPAHTQRRRVSLHHKDRAYKSEKNKIQTRWTFHG